MSRFSIIREFFDFLRERKKWWIAPIVLFLPRLDELTATNEVPIRAIKRELALRLKVPLVDVTPEIAPRGNALYLDADPVHFNAEGNAIIARRILTGLGQMP